MTENREPHAPESAPMPARSLWLLLTPLAFAACGDGQTAIAEQDRARLATALAAAEAKAEGYVAARTEALRGAVASPMEGGGPCTFALPPANALVRSANASAAPPTGPDAHTAIVHFSLLPRWALLGATPPPARGDRESLWARMGLSGTNHGQYELEHKTVKEALAAGKFPPGANLAQLEARIARLDSRAFWDWELVVITDSFTAAHELDDQRFASGEIVGRAVLWSYEEGRIRCMGPVRAENSEIVQSLKVDRRLGGGKNGFLEHDLEAQAFAAAVSALREVARAGAAPGASVAR